MPVQWPLATIDFEASGLQDKSYPIEVGICVLAAPDSQIIGWSTLIEPDPEWEKDGVWIAAAQTIHGITKKMTHHGIAPSATTARINDLIGTATAWCDGGDNDLYWAQRLTSAARLKASYKLGDIVTLYRKLGVIGSYKAFSWYNKQKTVHRALFDAEKIMRGYIAGLGIDQPHMKIIS